MYPGLCWAVLPACERGQPGSDAVHSLDRCYYGKPAFSLRLWAPFPALLEPLATRPATPPGWGKSPVRGCVCVLCGQAREASSSGLTHNPTPIPTSSSLHIRPQHSFPPQIRCYVLMGAAKALTQARSQEWSQKRASAPAPAARSPGRPLPPVVTMSCAA